MRCPRMRFTVGRMMILIMVVSVVTALVLPAIRVARDRATRYHHHFLTHGGRGEALIWTHPNQFFARYWRELIGRDRSGKMACDATEERRRLHPGYREIANGNNLAEMVDPYYYKRNLKFVLHASRMKVIEFEYGIPASGDCPIAFPDLVDGTIEDKSPE